MAGREEMQTARAEPIRLTYDDFLGFPDDGRRHELIDGEHFVTPAPFEPHQRLCKRILVALENHLEAHPIGLVYGAPFDVILSNHDVVEPDVIYLSKERRHLLSGWLRGAPDLAVEILSPSTRRTDEVTKRHLYDRFGVREYWLVDTEADAIRVYRRADDGSFPRVAELTAADDDALDTPLLPGFAVKLRRLFAPID